MADNDTGYNNYLEDIENEEHGYSRDKQIRPKPNFRCIDFEGSVKFAG